MRLDVDLSTLTPPRPRPTPTTQPYWDALRDHQLVVQRCDACAAWVHYPRSRCPSCGRAELRFEPVDAGGVVHAFTVARQPTAVHFRDSVPQVIAVVELAIGVRLTSTLLGADPETVGIGAAVEPVFVDGDDGVTMLHHRLVSPVA